MLDNPMFSVKVAHRHAERNFRVEIVPNPFGGVNTHLWRNEAYIIGIAPVLRPAYSLDKRNGKGLTCWVQYFETKHGVLFQQKILNHEAEDGVISLTEEARCGTDRVGVADDRLSGKSPGTSCINAAYSI